jgi:hypothetical protein
MRNWKNRLLNTRGEKDESPKQKYEKPTKEQLEGSLPWIFAGVVIVAFMLIMGIC